MLSKIRQKGCDWVTFTGRRYCAAHKRYLIGLITRLGIGGAVFIRLCVWRRSLL